MPTLTNAEARIAMMALTQLAQERLPVAGALRLRKVTRALAEHLTDVEAERLLLLERHARHSEDGKLLIEGSQYQFASDADRQAFNEAFGELMALTWEHGWGIRVSDLGDIKVAPAVLLDLGPLLEEPAE